MKRFVKILLEIIISIILIVLLFGPNLANKYINSNSEDLIGRKIINKDIDLNIFTGKLEIEDFKLFEENKEDIFISLDRLEVDISLFKLIYGEIHVNRLILDKPYVNIYLKDKFFNFDSFSTTEDSTNVEEERDENKIENKSPSQTQKDESFFKTYILNGVRLNNGQLNYQNFDHNISHNLKNINAALPSINWGIGDSDLDIEFNISKGGKIASDLIYNSENGNFDLKFHIKNLNLGSIVPYLRESITFGDLTGKGNADIYISGNINSFLASKISSKLELKNVKLSDINDQALIEIDSNYVELNNINLEKSIYDIEKIYFNGTNIHFTKEKSSSNFSSLIKQEKKDSIEAKIDTIIVKQKDKASWNVNNIKIENSKVYFRDKSLTTSNFNYEIKDINIETNKIKEGSKSELKIRANSKDGGHFKIVASADVANITSGSFNIYLNKISASDFSPYSIESTGYPIKGGKINISLTNKLEKDKLIGNFVIDAYSLNFGNKNDKVDAEIDIPLKTAMYLIKDKNDKIHIAMPMEGDLNDPDFSYSQTVSKVFISTILKIATSPFTILSSGFGLLDSDKLDEIELNYWQWELQSENEIIIDKVIEILEDKGNLKAEIKFQSNPELEQNNLAIYLEQLSFYNWKYKQNVEFYNINRKEQDIVSGIRIKDDDFIEYFNNKYKTSTKSRQIKEKIIELSDKEKLKSTLEKMNNSLILSLEDYVKSKNTKKLVVNSKIQKAPKNESSMFKITLIEE
jgi:hypothetical protein